MIKKKVIIGLLVTVAVLTTAVINGPIANAGQGSWGKAYFHNAWPTIPDGSVWPPSWIYPANWNGLIGGQHDGSNSGSGYLMPSWNGSSSNRANMSWDDGNGAIGYFALSSHVGGGISASQATGNSTTNTTNNKRLKEGLFNFLKSKNASGTDWEKMGSAVVVYGMVGKPWGSGNVTINSSDPVWNDLKNRLVENDSLVMVMDEYSNAINTSGVRIGSDSGAYDAVRYSFTGSDIEDVDAWVFYDLSVSSTVPVYAIEIGCANPLGTFNLPPYSPSDYSLTPNLNLPDENSLFDRSSTFSGTSSITKGGTTESYEVERRVTRLIYTADPTGKAAQGTPNPVANDPCSAFTSVNRLANADGCRTIQTEKKKFNANSGDISYSSSSSTYPLPTVAGGYRVCFVASVSRPTSSSTDANWRHSQMRCREVAPRFDITPGIKLTGENGLVDPSGSTSGSANLSNSKPGSDTSSPVEWFVTRYVYSDRDIPANLNKIDSSNDDPCTVAQFDNSAKRTDCSTVATWPRNGQITTAGTGDVPFSANLSGVEPGSRVCFVTSVKPPTQSDSTKWRHSEMKCLSVRKYSLTPSTGVTGVGTVTEPGGKGTVTIDVSNGGPDDSRTTYWRLTKYVYKPGTSLSSDDVKKRDSDTPRTNNAPCDDFLGGSNRDSCDNVWDNEKDTSTTKVFGTTPSSTTSGPAYDFTIPDDYAVGTRICFVSSVSPPTAADSPVWRHSNMVCVTVGKSPKIQVLGGDIRAGGLINTSTTEVIGKIYGSWGEYASLSNGCTTGLASGAALLGGRDQGFTPSWATLTFANAGVTGCSVGKQLGKYGYTSSAKGLRDQFTGSKELNSANLGDASVSTGNYRVGNLALQGSGDMHITRGKSIVIESTGTVTIKNNIVYEDGAGDSNRIYSNVKEIPQVVIHARNIHIESNVTHVDAWLLADDTVDTCSNIPPDTQRLTAGKCNAQLVVNGPVAAAHVKLNRTHGADPTSRAVAAEVFNLRADAYLWASGYRTGAVKTVYSVELPPRF